LNASACQAAARMAFGMVAIRREQNDFSALCRITVNRAQIGWGIA
jgi:hypothetical protein